jgi:hypothetical protein
MSKSSFPSEHEFWKWATTIPIASRDTGYGPIDPWGTQRHLVREILTGLNQGIHQFLVAKAGQVGASQTMQFLTTYWMQHYAGIQGAMVADADDNRDFFRDNLSQMFKQQALPEDEPLRIDNRNTIVCPNGSRLLFQTAGPRTGKRVGVGRGVALVWGTEVPLWQNPSSPTILRTRFSDAYPQRLLVFEGTSRGKNWWYDLWDEAEDAKDIKRITLLWWMREDQALDLRSEKFKHYWNNQLTSRERGWIKEVKRRHGHDLTPAQLAWRRWFVSEKAGGDDRTADQEQPTLIEESFEATGISFLNTEALRRVRKSVEASAAPKWFRYEFGLHIEATEVKPTIAARGELAVWETPEPVAGYVIAAVPANSATADCPDYVVDVFKATRDSCEQVAQFSTEEGCGMQGFAWVCEHLLASYQSPRKAFILELMGMGKGVLQELKSLRDAGWGTRQRKMVNTLVGNVQPYIWRRPDSLGGIGALMWQTSPDLMIFLMNRLRDQLASGTVVLRSQRTLNEIERVRQVGDQFMPEGKTPANHHVLAAALAVEAWRTQLMPIFQRVQGRSSATTVVGRTIEEFFGKLAAAK